MSLRAHSTTSHKPTRSVLLLLVGLVLLLLGLRACQDEITSSPQTALHQQ